MTEDSKTPPVKTHGLSFVAPRETVRSLAARSASYTRWVASLRIALPLTAAFVLLALFIWPMISAQKIAVAVMKNIPDLVIDNLHFKGLDSQNQAYSISAVKATRVTHGSGMYDLDKPVGEIALNSGSWISGKANMGRLDEGNHRLWLGGDVHVFQDNGFEFSTTEAQIDMQNRSAWGEKPVTLQGSFGEIFGQGFQLHDSGSTIVIKGPVKAILTPGKANDSSPAPVQQRDLHQGEGSDKPERVKTGHQ